MLADPERAPIDEKLRATLRFLEKLTLSPREVNADAAAAVLSAGVSPEALEEAIAISALFNLIDRVADALGFEVPSEKALARSARMLLRYGYR